MEEAIRILTIVVGPIVIFWTATSVMYAPELILRTPFMAKASILGMGVLWLALAVYLNDLGGASRGLAMVGVTLLAAPAAAYAVDRAVYSSSLQAKNLRLMNKAQF